MNARNVEALAKELTAVFGGKIEWARGYAWDEGDSRRFAEKLAERGVLVPTALTDNETVRITGLGWPDHMDPMRFNPRVNQIVREEMERIAKGEAWP
jgi:hypothetical protein